MNKQDRQLGMGRAISRRDFLSGAAVAIGASLLPGCSESGDGLAELRDTYYPPGQTGMRGAHAGSFEAAHGATRGQSWTAKPSGEHYDLVVVGAGISGLSAAFIYRRDINPNARILILDNHDDFGGHAKRNEFTINGQTLIGFGGTMLIDAVGTYPKVASDLFRDLGIDAHRSSDYQNNDLYASLGMRSGTFYDKETFGADHLTLGRYGDAEALKDAPLSETAKAQLVRLYGGEDEYLVDMTPEERRAEIESLSWAEYLKTHVGLGDEALAFIQKLAHGMWAIGADALPAFLAWYEGYPGFGDMDLGLGEDEEEEDTSRFHFPDGNASVARLLVRKLVPEVASGNTMEDVVSARFDYSKLDRPESVVRIRLSSTVVALRHQNGALEGKVEVTCVRDNEAQMVSADKVIWAGYHAMLPYVCSEIPADQTAALQSSVRAPLVYTNVLIRNWKSFAALGLRRAYCPGSFFHSVMVDFPVSMGDYKFSQSPDEPILLHLQHIPVAPGLSAPDQFREGRNKLLQTPFETFERNIRDQLGRMLGAGGFDPARDIAGITVNRWPHGYAFSIDPESNDVAWWPEKWQHRNRPWVEARQRIGNIAIAGTDAASNAMTEAAIEEAHRAVHSLKV